MVIYLDELLAVNFAADYMIISAAAAVSSSQTRRGRFLLAAAAGSLYSACAAVTGLDFFSGAASRLTAAMAMTFIAFGFNTVQQFLRRSAVLFITGFAFAGFLELLFSDKTYPVPPAYVLISSVFLAYILLSFFLRGTPSASASPVPKLSVFVETDYGKCEFSALSDTGNRLRDPFTGDRVLVVSLSSCPQLIPSTAAETLKTSGAAAALSTVSGSRLIPYKSLGGDGLLLAVRPKRLLIDGKPQKHIMIAFTCEELSASTGCAGMIGV